MADVMICSQSAQVLVDGERLEWVRAERTTAHSDHPVVTEYPHLWRPLPINFPSPAFVGECAEGTPEDVSPEVEAPAEPSAKDVRAWAADNDIEVNAKGPLPADVVERYKQAHTED